MSDPIHEDHTADPGWLQRGILRFSLAMTFLTRVPLRIPESVTPEDLRASMGWYPLVGLGLGALGWLAYAACVPLFSPLLTAALVIVLLEGITGALHLDGVMDTCDGIGSGAERERALEIMKDSRVGAMGVFGAIAIVLVKVLALASVEPSRVGSVLLLSWMAGRSLPVWSATLFPYARPAGTGGAFAGGGAAWARIQSTLIAFAAAWLIGGWTGCVAVTLAAASVLAIQSRIARRLGGLTGDVYGMGIELTETAVLLFGCLIAPLSQLLRS